MQWHKSVPEKAFPCKLYQQILVSSSATGNLVRCLSVLNVHFCKKSPKLAQMTFDRYLSNPDIGRTFWDGLTHSN